jgi:hypothetical protein
VRRSSTARAARIRTWSLVAAQEAGLGTLVRIDINVHQNTEVGWKAQKRVVSKASGRPYGRRNFGLPIKASIPVAELIIS